MKAVVKYMKTNDLRFFLQINRLELNLFSGLGNQRSLSRKLH
jgi:hypothetical protein